MKTTHILMTIPPNVWADSDLPESNLPSMDYTNGPWVLLLETNALYLGKEKNWFVEMAQDGNTILRVIHYPPIAEDVTRRVRAHNMKTSTLSLLVGATADGLEVMDHDGSWIAVENMITSS